MNCKPGDLAVITDPHPGYYGRMVEVVNLYGVTCLSIDPSPHWRVKPLGWAPCNVQLAAGLFMFPDARLRPIRDQPGEDETLTWAGKPKTLEVV